MIVNYILLLVLLVLFAGLGIDAGFLQYYETQLGFAAKASAISMTLAMQRGYSSTAILNAGQTTAQLNGWVNGVNGVKITYENPPTAGTSTGISGAARVVISDTLHNNFMSILGAGTSVVTAQYTQPAAVVVNLSSQYNVWGIWTDSTHIQNGGLDNYSTNNAAFSANLLAPVRLQSNLPAMLSWRGFLFFLGPPNAADAVSQATIPLPSGSYSQLLVLTATAIGNATNVTFTVTYTDKTTATQSFNSMDWCKDQFTGNSGSDPVWSAPYRNINVSYDTQNPSYIQYKINFITGHSIALDRTKTVTQVATPAGSSPAIIVMAMDLIR